MGRRGPKPTPTAVLKLRGSWRGEKNRYEPKPEKKKRIPPPSWLSDDAKNVWKRIFPIVRNMRVMTTADVEGLARYCDTIITWRRASEFINTNGIAQPIIETEIIQRGQNGEPDEVNRRVVGFKRYPQFEAYKTLPILLLKYEEVFGLNPSSRSRLTTEPLTTHEPILQDNGKPDILRLG